MDIKIASHRVFPIRWKTHNYSLIPSETRHHLSDLGPLHDILVARSESTGPAREITFERPKIIRMVLAPLYSPPSGDR